MHAEEGEYQVQLNAGSRGGHLHEEGRARGGSSGSTQPLSSTDGLVASMERFLHSISMSAISDVSTGHIFSLDF